MNSEYQTPPPYRPSLLGKCSICLSDLQRECGGILNGTVGIIQSRPFDPLDNYERQISCSWAIVVPEADVVFFEFETIDVEYDATCSKDYIQVRVFLDFSLSVEAATIIFIYGRGSAIPSDKQGKSGFIYNVVKK